MRYENWDVLLFPGGSKAPIQEFKTQCFVTKDTDSPYLQLSAMMSPPQFYPAKSNVGQVPVLTSFIPSLYKDSPFRVSVHNWGKPQPSRFIEKFMQPDDVLTFEVRVFIDGVLSASAFFGQRCSWPYVIDFGFRIVHPPNSDSASTDAILDLDRNGGQDVLRFPGFHPEILEHQYWDAGDPFGRIKVVIAEGFARPNRSPPFERFKDVVTMSFQHAPLQVLEHSSIAWPNPSMWTQDVSIESRYNSMTEFGARSRDETAHGHSPTRPEPRLLPSSMTHPSKTQELTYSAWATNRAFPVPASQWQRPGEQRRWAFCPESYIEPFLSEQGLDSFINEDAWIHRGARSSREDVPMPDYSISSGSRAISSMTGVSYEHSKQPSMESIMDDDQYNELLQSLTPTKPGVMGIRAPSNTPSAVLTMTPTTMPAPAKLSGGAETRSARRARGSARGSGRGSGRASILREISQPSTRDVSGSSNKSNIPPEKNITPSKASPSSKLGLSPSGNVKGKKEGPNENMKISPKRTPQKDTIDEAVVRTSPQDGNVKEDEQPGEKEQETAMHQDGDVISACIV